MVFRGRPSKGCGACRRKKIKCDQIRPACSQCLKSKDGHRCPGYRDDQALKFLDESSEVARKAQAKRAIQLQRRDVDFPEYSKSSSCSIGVSASDRPCPAFSGDRSSMPVRQGSHLPCALRPSLETQGISYFLANYVMSDSDLCPGHLQHLLSRKTTQSKTIQVAMGAVGLAGLSNQRNDPSLMVEAQHKYTIAVQMTKGHLQDPFRCKEDRTITAVALLGIFEILSCPSPTSMTSWINHTNGSTALLNLRGADLLKSEFGSAIFTQARSQILISCYQRDAHVPPVVLSLSRQLSRNQKLSCLIGNDLLELISQLCEFRASIRDGSLTDPATNITSLLKLETGLIDWAAQRSSRWDYSIVFDSTNSEHVYDDSYSVYRSWWMAGTWNIHRATRIYAHESILAQIEEILSHPQSLVSTTLHLLSSQHTKSLAVVSELASDICASVPYLLGHDRPYVDQLNDPVPAAGGYSLLTPLYLAGSTVGVPQELRRYVLNRLEYIGHRLGIRQSLLIGHVLRGKIEGERVHGEEIEGLPWQMMKRLYLGGLRCERGQRLENERAESHEEDSARYDMERRLSE